MILLKQIIIINLFTIGKYWTIKDEAFLKIINLKRVFASKKFFKYKQLTNKTSHNNKYRWCSIMSHVVVL